MYIHSQPEVCSDLDNFDIKQFDSVPAYILPFRIEKCTTDLVW